MKYINAVLTWLTGNLTWIIPTITTLFLGIVNIVYLKAQAKREQIQISLSLMEKRLNIYYILKNFAGDFLLNDSEDLSEIHKFIYETQDAGLYFEDDIVEFIKQITDLGVEKRTIQKKVNTYQNKVSVYYYNRDKTPDYDELESNLQIYRTQKDDFVDRISEDIVHDDIIYKKFLPYLDFRNYKVPKK